VAGREIAGVVQVQVRLYHDSVLIVRLNLPTERVSVSDQKRAAVPVFGFEVFIIKLIHYEFGDFQNGKYNCDGFVQFDFLSRCAHHDQIVTVGSLVPRFP